MTQSDTTQTAIADRPTVVVQVTDGVLEVVCADAPVRVICVDYDISDDEDINATDPDGANASMWESVFGGAFGELEPERVAGYEHSLAAGISDEDKPEPEPEPEPEPRPILELVRELAEAQREKEALAAAREIAAPYFDVAKRLRPAVGLELAASLGKTYGVTAARAERAALYFGGNRLAVYSALIMDGLVFVCQGSGWRIYLLTVGKDDASTPVLSPADSPLDVENALRDAEPFRWDAVKKVATVFTPDDLALSLDTYVARWMKALPSKKMQEAAQVIERSLQSA